MSPSQTLLTGVRVLVVDDCQTELEILALVFRHQGADVSAVISAEQALRALKEAAYDVLVSDIMLPGVDGYELVEAVREWAPDEGGQIPAVAVTGCALASDSARAVDAGFQVHLAKPVPVDTLTAVVAALAKAGRSSGTAGTTRAGGQRVRWGGGTSSS